MPIETVIKKIRHNIDLIIAQKSEIGLELWEQLMALHPADIASILMSLERLQFRQLFLLLPPSKMCAVFREFPEDIQVSTLSVMNEEGTLGTLSCLPHDELTDLFENLSDEDLKKYLKLLHKTDREKVLSLLQFDPESAGGIMDTEVLALSDDFTVQKSIQLIQRLQVPRELHRQIYVIDQYKKLVGHIMLEDLVLQKPEARVKDFMRENEMVAQADEDQESIAKKMVHYTVLTVPVVGKDGYFLGVIPGETLIDVIEEEASEDVYRMSAMVPLKGTYFGMSLWKVFYQRSYILIILLLMQSISTAIVQYHELLLSGFLFIYITMLTSAGGNASSQTSAIIIQGMASGEINESNVNKFFKRELLLALFMGIVLGVAGFARVYWSTRTLLGSFVVSLSLGCIVFVSMAIGSCIPVVLKRLNVDPSHSAGPILATIMDIFGLFIYCSISKMFIMQ